MTFSTVIDHIQSLSVNLKETDFLYLLCMLQLDKLVKIIDARTFGHFKHLKQICVH